LLIGVRVEFNGLPKESKVFWGFFSKNNYLPSSSASHTQRRFVLQEQRVVVRCVAAEAVVIAGTAIARRKPAVRKQFYYL
jgi:hypothetical protein